MIIINLEILSELYRKSSGKNGLCLDCLPVAIKRKLSLPMNTILDRILITCDSVTIKVLAP